MFECLNFIIGNISNPSPTSLIFPCLLTKPFGFYVRKGTAGYPVQLSIAYLLSTPEKI